MDGMELSLAIDYCRLSIRFRDAYCVMRIASEMIGGIHPTLRILWVEWVLWERISDLRYHISERG